MELKDYFVCHAATDKVAFVRPVVRALDAAGMSMWVDEAEILAGDSLIRKVSDGMTAARYVLAVLTPAFVERPWPEYELETALGRQAARGEVRVVPLTHGLDTKALNRLIGRFPMLEGVRRLRWEDGVATVVDELERRLGRAYSHHWEHHHPGEYGGPVWMRITGAPEIAGQSVNVRVEWGTWACSWSGVLPGGRGPLVLRHHKARDTEPKRLNAYVSRDGERCDVYVEFGTGNPLGTAVEPRWHGLSE